MDSDSTLKLTKLKLVYLCSSVLLPLDWRSNLLSYKQLYHDLYKVTTTIMEEELSSSTCHSGYTSFLLI